ncbi:MAG: ABC transporter permease [Thermoanaerobaculia bacterium]
MTNPTDVMPEHADGNAGAAAVSERPFYWSVRRELWENRSLVIAPVVVASVALLGFALSLIGFAERRREALLLDAASQQARIGAPYGMVALILVVTGVIVALFYCIDALHAERRDRSILFWKSLPLSDRTTVLAKASIPFAVVPAIIFTVTFTAQVVMALLSTLALLAHGMSPASTFAVWNPPERAVLLAYGLFALVLWHAPLYAWFLFVSAWARRAIVLWALVPVIALSALFRVAWGSTDVCSLLVYRAIGGIQEAFTVTTGGRIDSISQLRPGHFITRPGLWIGLVIAAVLIAVTVRVRRNREPL